MYYDVFNGDADGIFALHQLRLAHPAPDATLVTGVKRDINLLKKISEVSSAEITVLDVSLDKNRDELVKLLKADNKVLYIDHHYSGEIPQSQNLNSHIEPSAQTCTSIIVNELLEGRYSRWAVCGAFGDNLDEQANLLAAESGLDAEQVELLKEVGELFNYNGYGAQLGDLHFHPAELYKAVHPFEDPLLFYNESDLVDTLRNGYINDMGLAESYTNIAEEGSNRIYRFPAESWARRIVGVFSNMKAREKRNAAHAIIVENNDKTLQISVRAPLNQRTDADTLCRMFPTGGGRAAAAGINHLPPEMLDTFIQSFSSIYSNSNNS